MVRRCGPPTPPPARAADSDTGDPGTVRPGVPVYDKPVSQPLSENACHTRSIPRHFGTTVQFSTGVVSEWHAIRPKLPRTGLPARGARRRIDEVGRCGSRWRPQHPSRARCYSQLYEDLPQLVWRSERGCGGGLSRVVAERHSSPAAVAFVCQYRSRHTLVQRGCSAVAGDAGRHNLPDPRKYLGSVVTLRVWRPLEDTRADPRLHVPDRARADGSWVASGHVPRGTGTITCTNRRKGCPKIEAR